MVTPNGVSGPHVLDTVYISEVNEARKLKSDAEVAMKKTQTPCRFFLQWLGAQCLQVIFFQTFKIGRNESSYDGKVKIYLQTKFRWDVTIHGWDIATSGFWKQTAAMLELYFRFLSSRLRHHRHVIAHQPTKFHPNRTIHDIVMTSYPFSKMAATASQFYFRGRNWPHILICGVDLPFHHPSSNGIAGRLRCVYWRSPHVKARFEPKFSSRRKSTKNFRFGSKMGSKCKI